MGRKCSSPIAQALLIKQLSVDSATYEEMSNLTGLSPRTLASLVKEFRFHNLMHIAGWDADTRGFPTVARFAWGHKPDAIRPSIPRSVMQKNLRQRKQALAALPS